MLLVDSAHERSRRRENLSQEQARRRGSGCQWLRWRGKREGSEIGRGWAYLVDEDEDCLLRRKLDSLADHVHKLPNSQILGKAKRERRRSVSTCQSSVWAKLTQDAGRNGPHTDGTRYFLADDRHDDGISIHIFSLIGEDQDAVGVTDFLSMVGMSEVERGLRGERGARQLAISTPLTSTAPLAARGERLNVPVLSPFSQITVSQQAERSRREMWVSFDR